MLKSASLGRNLFVGLWYKCWQISCSTATANSSDLLQERAGAAGDEMPELSAQKARGSCGAAVGQLWGCLWGLTGGQGRGGGGEIPTNAHSACLPPRSAWCG